jgi:hypothetical protein
MILRLTTLGEKSLDSRSPAFGEDKLRGNDVSRHPHESGGSTAGQRGYFHGREIFPKRWYLIQETRTGIVK